MTMIVFGVCSLAAAGLMLMYYLAFLRDRGLLIGSPDQNKKYEKPLWIVTLTFFVLGLITVLA